MPWTQIFQRRHLEVMEESCDDAASELVGQQSEYARALAHAAGIRGEQSSVQTNMHAHHLVGRVGRFTHQPRVELNTPGVSWCVMAILVCVVMIMGVRASSISTESTSSTMAK